ncbi:hypothetical protein LY76DRAFT_647693 [Colletotrichum caudatum]|nr:hypothetical protein LY76DRAFT_647693 [Colletotrichum caudatum]
MLHRRRDWTSNLVIHREIAVRKNLMRRHREKMRERYGLPAQDTREWEPKERRRVTDTPIVSISDEKKLLADCVLRPARLDDAIGCAEIYNAAVADHDHQVVDTRPVSARRFEFIMEECQENTLPFVVAVMRKVDLSDAKNWPSLDAYRQDMRWKQPQPKEDEPTEYNICGFPFLMPYERRIGGFSSTASAAVKATVFVRPDSRRGGIGSALIRIIAHTMAKSEDNQSLQWMTNFMTSLQFEKAGSLSQVYRVDSSHGVEWHDQIVWQH